ncbi:YfaP family protein [Pelomyxa schiedti]|nr:YfaP family protein [Pelomyxa schiedti]
MNQQFLISVEENLLLHFCTTEEATISQSSHLLKEYVEDSSVKHICLLHCAYFIKNKSWALTVLSNIAELNLDNVSQLRAAAMLCEQLSSFKEAIWLYKKILSLRPEEPQSYRDLALALWHSERTKENYEKALSLLDTVLDKEWDKRFEQIEVLAMMEINSIWKEIETEGIGAFIKHNVYSDITSYALEVDIRIVLTWDKDMTDVDLHVLEPSGEECTPFHNQTAHGGVMSEDFTRGYGPVEYAIKNAQPGAYGVFASVFYQPTSTKNNPVTVCVHVYTNFARPGLQKSTVNTAVLCEENTKTKLVDIFIPHN